jgi:hypothetical protein
MITRNQQRDSQRAGRALVTTSLLLAGLGASAANVAAQEAIGVPFIGGNHLSFYMTELSKDGVAQERAALFGGVYGHRFGERVGGIESSLVIRLGARARDDLHDGILESGATLALTKAVPSVERLSVTAAAGIGAVAWGQGSFDVDEPNSGRLSLRAPMSAGLAYEIRAGRATIAPFAAFTTAWSSERVYLEDQPTTSDNGWSTGRTMGVSVRFRETVLSLSGVHGERGMPHNGRYVFSAGMSW